MGALNKRIHMDDDQKEKLTFKEYLSKNIYLIQVPI